VKGASSVAQVEELGGSKTGAILARILTAIAKIQHKMK
jgi:hypothetical protein